MALPLDLTGDVYGRLTALRSTGRTVDRNYVWQFRCECGNEIEVPAGEVRKGRTRSCGCLQRELSSVRMKALAETGLGSAATVTHGMTGSPEWISWNSMKQRCLNARHKSFRDYGGRGIEVCREWVESFETFFSDMGPRPAGTSLDRIDVNKDYTPENCRWATSSVQGNNRRDNRLLEFRGVTMTVAEWASKVGIGSKTIAYRIKSGWSIERALTTPSTRAIKGEAKFSD